MMNDQQRLLDIYLKEYELLKQEQIQRISFRDNLLYFTLGVYATILGFALGKEADANALLVLPWVSLVLGWTYLVNDQKITAIGRYIRYKLVDKVSSIIGKTNIDIESIFGWEIAHRTDKRRKRRKLEQLIIDEIAFVFSGLAALIAFRHLVTQADGIMQFLYVLEFVLLMFLGIEIFLHADWTKE